MSNTDRLPYVEAELNYLGATTERPRYYAYDRADTDPPSHMPLEPHKMRDPRSAPDRRRAVARRAGFRAGRAAQRGARFLGR